MAMHHHCGSPLKRKFIEEVISTKTWREMISLYTRKNFTYQTDVLPALSGITNRVRGAGQYYGGIWEQSLPYDLPWFSTMGSSPTLPHQPSAYIAPSFLWASVKGSISFVNIDQDTRDFTQTFSIREISLTPKGEDPLGQLADGHIVLEAPFLLAKFVCNIAKTVAADTFIRDAEPSQKCLWDVLTLPIFEENYIFHPNSDLKADEQKHLACLQLFKHTDDEDDFCYAMVVRAQSHRSGSLSAYERVGIIASIPKSKFEAAQVTKITIR